MPGELTLYVIFGPNATDYPGQYTVRTQMVRNGEIVHGAEPIGHGQTLDEARRLIPEWMTCLGRDRGDEPQIVEAWI
jgi:hypothetical protein